MTVEALAWVCFEAGVTVGVDAARLLVRLWLLVAGGCQTCGRRDRARDLACLRRDRRRIARATIACRRARLAARNAARCSAA
jgi:hypothetical protein